MTELCGLAECNRPAVNDYDLQGYCNGLHQAIDADRNKFAAWLEDSPWNGVEGCQVWPEYWSYQIRSGAHCCGRGEHE